MAFIVPVMKKDYMLYQKKPASSASSSGNSKLRSTSNPILVPSRPATAACGPMSSSVDSVVRQVRRAPRKHKRSVRRISESDNDRASGTERHVHFGVCEEITYDELEEAFDETPGPADCDSGNSSLEEQDSPMRSSLFLEQQLGLKKSKPIVILSEKRPDEPSKPLSSSAPVLPVSTSPSKMQNVFKLVALCTPKN